MRTHPTAHSLSLFFFFVLLDPFARAKSVRTCFVLKSALARSDCHTFTERAKVFIIMEASWPG